MKIKQLTLTLSEQEQEVLRVSALREYRTPQAHAKYLLVKSLGLLDPPKPQKEAHPHDQAQ